MLPVPTLVNIRRQLAEAEKKEIESNRDLSLDPNITPLQLISTGIDLEAEQ